MKNTLLFALTLMLAGRAMTLAFIGSAGGMAPGDPPAAWLMPLVGDAVIGLSALGIAYLVMAGKGLWAWTAIIVWNVLGIWDAMSAFILHLTAPWPEFFMVEIFGASMFFAASGMHAFCIYLASRETTRDAFLGRLPATA